MDIYEESLQFHKKHRGKISVVSKTEIKDRHDLSVVYTPGVAEPCREIARKPDEVWELTNRANTVAVITDGSAVLGLGDIGADAGLPVMEGKCVLFKEFANIDAFPILISTRDIGQAVETIKNISHSFGGINLEDIGAPRCFDIEEQLVAELDIPIMHDDQHGTAIVVSAGLLNALAVTSRSLDTAKIVIAGAGAAGTAIAKMLLSLGAKDIIVTDSKGIIGPSRGDLGKHKNALRDSTNPGRLDGGTADALVAADVFIGVSGPNTVTEEMARAMARDSIIFALSNPTPEIMPEVAQAAGAKVIATGRSDFPNQVNNALAFPGIFRGALDARAKKITTEMKLAAVYALAGYVQRPSPELIIPDVLDRNVTRAVAAAVKGAA